MAASQKSKKSSLVDLYILALVAGRRLAFPLDQVREVLTLPRVREIPSLPTEICGLAIVHSCLPLMIIHLGACLGYSGAASAPPVGFLIKVQHEEEEYGFLVDKVEKMHLNASALLEPMPIESKKGVSEVFRDFFHLEGKIIPILDTGRLFRRIRHRLAHLSIRGTGSGRKQK